MSTTIEISTAVELVSNAFKLSPDVVRQVLEGEYRKCYWVGKRIGNCKAIANPGEVFCKRHRSEVTFLTSVVTAGCTNESDMPDIKAFTSENFLGLLGEMMGKRMSIGHNYYLPEVGVFEVTKNPDRSKTVKFIQGNFEAFQALALGGGNAPRLTN